jgi:hypothetical protein
LQGFQIVEQRVLLERKDSWTKRGYTGLDLPHYGRQHNHKWTATKKLPPISCMPPLCGSGRFPALPYSPQRDRIEYSKMLLPQSDKSMKSGSPTTFGTIINLCAGLWGFSGNGIRPGTPKRFVVAARETTLTAKMAGKSNKSRDFD